MRAARPFYGALVQGVRARSAAGELDREQARAFFEDNFKPMRVMPAGQTQGFFTGYYETGSGRLALSQRRIHHSDLRRAG